MAIRTYNDDINRDFAILGNNVYLENGQGCGTIWYKTVPIARKALNSSDKIISGKDLVDCNNCRCHYSNQHEDYLKFDEFICKKAKEDYAKKFE